MTALKYSISFISLGERKHFLNNRFYLGIKRKKRFLKNKKCNTLSFSSMQPSHFKVIPQKKVPKQLAIKKMGHQVCKRDVGES